MQLKDSATLICYLIFSSNSGVYGAYGGAPQGEAAVGWVPPPAYSQASSMMSKEQTSLCSSCTTSKCISPAKAMTMVYPTIQSFEQRPGSTNVAMSLPTQSLAPPPFIKQEQNVYPAYPPQPQPQQPQLYQQQAPYGYGPGAPFGGMEMPRYQVAMQPQEHIRVPEQPAYAPPQGKAPEIGTGKMTPPMTQKPPASAPVEQQKVPEIIGYQPAPPPVKEERQQEIVLARPAYGPPQPSMPQQNVVQIKKTVETMTPPYKTPESEKVGPIQQQPEQPKIEYQPMQPQQLEQSKVVHQPIQQQQQPEQPKMKHQPMQQPEQQKIRYQPIQQQHQPRMGYQPIQQQQQPEQQKVRYQPIHQYQQPEQQRMGFQPMQQPEQQKREYQPAQQQQQQQQQFGLPYIREEKTGRLILQPVQQQQQQFGLSYTREEKTGRLILQPVQQQQQQQQQLERFINSGPKKEVLGSKLEGEVIPAIAGIVLPPATMSHPTATIPPPFVILPQIQEKASGIKSQPNQIYGSSKFRPIPFPSEATLAENIPSEIASLIQQAIGTGPMESTEAETTSTTCTETESMEAAETSTASTDSTESAEPTADSTTSRGVKKQQSAAVGQIDLIEFLLGLTLGALTFLILA